MPYPSTSLVPSTTLFPSASTVVVSHVYTAENLSAANPTISVTDTPAAGNVLVLVSGSNGLAISAVSGCGATWTRVTGFRNNDVLDAWIGTGATGSGTVTVTSGSGARALEVLMVSGLTSSAVGVNTFASGTTTTPSQTAAPNQLVVGAGWSDTSSGSLSAEAPSTGWNVNRLGMNTNAQYMGVGYRVPPVSAGHTVSATRAGVNCFVSQMVIGDIPTGNTISSPLSGTGTLTSHLGLTLNTALSGSGSLASNLTNYRKIASGLSGSGTLVSTLGRLIASGLSGSGTLTSHLALHIASGLSGSGTLSSVLGRTLHTSLSGSGALSSALSNYPHFLSAGLSGSGTLTSSLAGFRHVDSQLSGSGTLTSALTNYRKISSAFSSEGTLSIFVGRFIHVPLSGTGTLTSHLTNYLRIASAFGSEGVLYSELGYVFRPTPLAQAYLGKLSDFSVATSGVPVNPAKGSGSVPAISATYVVGTDPEYALGEENVLSNGAIGTYEGEIVRLTLAANSGRASVSMDTPLTLLNVDAHLYPFIDSDPGTWTASRAIEYWTQQCGLTYDNVPGTCTAYASGFGHVDAYGANTKGRFYEKLSGGTANTQVVNGRSVRTLGDAVIGTTAFHDAPVLTPLANVVHSTKSKLPPVLRATTPMIVPATTQSSSVAVSVPKNRKLIFSTGLALLGSGRTGTVEWGFLDRLNERHYVTLAATSSGVVTASVDAVDVASATVAAGGMYRLAFSLEAVSTTSTVCKLTVHTDDLAGNGTLVYASASTTISQTLPAVLNLATISHASSGGSGAQMLRWGTYLAIDDAHPMQLPAVQKVLGQTSKTMAFVSGFAGNVWTLLNEFCFFARLDVQFIDRMMHVSQQDTTLTAPGGTWTVFSYTTERRDKFKQVAVTNRQSKAVTTGDGVLWKADSVFQVAAREVFETTVQTNHSILSLSNPVAVGGILPFPYTQGTGQYVVTGADGYIVAPGWWNDNGGKVEVALTDKEGEIAIKITAPAVDSVRAPYRISEGAADRPAFYISGSGIICTPKDVVVSTGATKAKEGHDSVYASPFIAGLAETYDAAMAMASEYSAAASVLNFELPNDFDTPTGLGQSPAGRIITDNSRNYRITDTTQTKSKVSGNAVAHTTIGAYVASYPAGATLADEKARHAGKTIRQFNIKPLRSSSENS